MRSQDLRTNIARLGLGFCLLASLGGDDPAKVKAGKPQGKANRLARETSPYLLLHAHNPVDWYPWGPEAFARAKAENKPIFLSVGYSACFWCHVMERESFNDPEVAARLNAGFVCIKVDREERPDVDTLYMAAVQAYSGSGGWPMTVFLLPDGRPFFGGTYFPPKDRDEMPGFGNLLTKVSDAWRDKRPLLEKDAANLTDAVRRSVDRAETEGRVPLTRALASGGIVGLAEQYDDQYGGFGFSPQRPERPKFPEPVNLEYLLDQDRRAAGKVSPARAMVDLTFDRMARGGIRDHLAGGYHRYSTKRDWSVPHFEKMLYDNAQLASVHVRAYELRGDPRWRAEAEATFAFVARSLTSPEGAFYSALDAESEHEEGRSYVWTPAEVVGVLGDADAALFAKVYGLDGKSNFEGGRYVLRLPKPVEEVDIPLAGPRRLDAALAAMRRKLLAARDLRAQPLRDDKILTSWNGLMIAAYADGYRVLEDPAYRVAADRAADFVLERLRAPDGRLFRTHRDGRTKLAGYLEDYAFLAHGLLRLHAATGDPKRLQQAKAIATRMVLDFSDKARGGFYDTADGHESLIARAKSPADGALPGANSVAIRVLVALGRLTGDAAYLDEAHRALDAFSPWLSRVPAGSPLMLMALDEYLDVRPAAAVADGLGPANPPASVGVVTATTGTITPRGAGVEIPVTLKVGRGYHIYANPPQSSDVPPTTLALVDAEGWTLERVEYPAGTVKALAANKSEKVALYEGEVTLRAVVVPKPGKTPGPATLTLRIKYQACDDRACLAPARLDVPVQVTPGR